MSQPMLSVGEAMAMGALLKPQAYGPLDYPEKTCAMQAAHEARGDTGEMAETYQMRGADDPWMWVWVYQGHCYWCPDCLIALAVVRVPGISLPI